MNSQQRVGLAILLLLIFLLQIANTPSLNGYGWAVIPLVVCFGIGIALLVDPPKD